MPQLKKVKLYQDKSVFMIEGNSIKKLQEKLGEQINKEMAAGNTCDFPVKETNTMLVLNN